jgi:hypothetical protein
MPISDELPSKQGILYVATGKKYAQEAIKSARSFKQRMPDVPIAIFTDDATPTEKEEIFDNVIILERPKFHYLDKVEALQRTPYEKTLFLDTDTYCVESCYELFALLERFDIAAAHSPVRVSTQNNGKCPLSFPELNTGVIVYRNSREVCRVIEHWRKIFCFQLSKGFNINDQPAFREAVYQSSLQIGILTPEYNLRTCFPYFVGGNALVKIVHDRGKRVGQAVETAKTFNDRKKSNPKVRQSPAVQRQIRKLIRRIRWGYSNLKILVWQKIKHG